MKPIAFTSTILSTAFAVVALAVFVAHAGTSETQRCGGNDAASNARVIELAICLDTSGSMDGLINSARQKLWTIVNDLAKAEPTPTLRVALLSYGNDGNNAENGWVKVETPFTEDLDTVSQMLFALTTNGGTELVGRVVQTSLEELDWHASADALRMIFVAGNESADQDERIAARTICTKATQRGIDINAIYCVYGDDDSEVLPGWRELAGAGNGEFAMIDQDNGTVVIATPYDEKLIALSAELNKTYIPFGDAGQAGCSNQIAQDSNAVKMNSANAASRAATKAGKLYTCSWDLVDAIRTGKVDLKKVDDKDLPKDMRNLTHAQRVAKVDSMQHQRSELQQQISELDKRRQALLMRELARSAKSNVGSFDIAIRNAMRKKAEALGFRFPTATAPKFQLVSYVEKKPRVESFEYFVQFASGSMNTWVSNDLVADFADARSRGKNFTHDVHIIPNTPEAEKFIGALPDEMRALVRSLQGAIYLGWNGKIYLVTGGC